MSKNGLENLPVEVQLLALSDSFPFVSRRILAVFRASSCAFRAQYLLGRVIVTQDRYNTFTGALRYPLCTQEVLESFSRQIPEDICPRSFDLPRRLFRDLVHKPEGMEWNERHHPLPFLRYLYDSPRIPYPIMDANEGYALIKAVHSKFVPLVKFLLARGASPECKNNLAVMVAIRQKDLSLVKLLVERGNSSYELWAKRTSRNKRQRLEDRVQVNQEMLKVAVRCDARDIVDYFMEKGCIPNMQTLGIMTR